MATPTLLEIVQNILSRLESDEVNSISDTVESMQVARIVENKYYDIIARDTLPDQQGLLQFTASGDSTKPVLMYVPAGVSKIEWIKYFDANPADGSGTDQFGAYSHGVNTDIINTLYWATTSSTSNTISTGAKTFTVASSILPVVVGQGVSIASGTNTMFGTVTSYVGTTLVVNIISIAGSGTYSSWTIVSAQSDTAPGYKYVTMLPIDEFLDFINRFNPSDPNVLAFTFSEGGNNFTFYYRNDKQPRYCTIIENTYIVFDCYDATFDSTLQASKVMAFGTSVTPFQMVDTFVPDLNDSQFPLLLNESISLAFYELKQMPHAKADQEIRRQWSQMQKSKSVDNKPSYFDQLANFGRVPRTGGYSSGGYGAYKWMRQSGP